MSDTKIRKNLTLSPELGAWYDEKARQIGITVSSMMVMALADYKKQDEAMAMINKMSIINNSISEREQLKGDNL